MFKLIKFFKAFIYAFKGIISGFKERNMKFHGLVAILVIVASWWFNLSKFEWFAVLVLIGVIWSVELVNTSIEELCDLVRDELSLEYKATQRARDTAAGAVLVLAIVATLIGLTIFVPKII